MEAVRKSDSMISVLKNLGYGCLTGRMHSHITKRAKELGADFSYFKKFRFDGINNTGGHKRKTPSEILVENSSPKTRLLKRALLEIGVPYECKCGNKGDWQGKKLVLQIEHKNGVRTDNRRENLEFLCPNCHSQTETYSKPKKN